MSVWSWTHLSNSLLVVELLHLLPTDEESVSSGANCTELVVYNFFILAIFVAHLDDVTSTS